MNTTTRFERLPRHQDYPTDSREVNLLALGLQHIAGLGAPWNDPTASMLTAVEKQYLRQRWPLRSTADALLTVQDLVNERRRRPLWQRLLALRDEAAHANDGRRPSEQQWLRAIGRAEGTDESEAPGFVRAVHASEAAIGPDLFPPDEPVVSLDAYALGQAAAVSVWAVGLGLLSRTDSLRLLEQINAAARSEFDSWAAFGRSSVLGLAMHSGDGVVDEPGLHATGAAAAVVRAALDGASRGPWAVLPWRI